MTNFKPIDPAKITDNFIDLIGHQWMLITAGDERECNTMTASWGLVGHLWGKHVAVTFIRPQRHTKHLVDREERLSLSFFDPAYKEALAYCGSHTGRDENKISNAGLSVVYTPQGTPAITEARLILDCRKLYVGNMDPRNFLEAGIVDKWYPENDFHHVYVSEITHAYTK